MATKGKGLQPALEQPLQSQGPGGQDVIVGSRRNRGGHCVCKDKFGAGFANGQRRRVDALSLQRLTAKTGREHVAQARRARLSQCPANCPAARFASTTVPLAI